MNASDVMLGLLGGAILGFFVAAHTAASLDEKRIESGIFEANGHVYRLVEVKR